MYKTIFEVAILLQLNVVIGHRVLDGKKIVRGDQWIGLESNCNCNGPRCYLSEQGGDISIRGPLNNNEKWKIVPYNRASNDPIHDGDIVRLYYGGNAWLGCDCGGWCEKRTCPGTA